eukprot:CAMPEP_0185258554 /NCGR_PEP_ID=MMETSP1359-20130426/7454_1 /TAXON_ID=552665 /ORGANISM="Bigelowiella longifila, Strain CCMP242" /LENGTH=81 /DNA_ID=CAMNT_0027844085 /DNA_START=44 /DNA_END=289 /DNA_ORIENTATION=-
MQGEAKDTGKSKSGDVGVKKSKIAEGSESPAKGVPTLQNKIELKKYKSVSDEIQGGLLRQESLGYTTKGDKYQASTQEESR